MDASDGDIDVLNSKASAQSPQPPTANRVAVWMRWIAAGPLALFSSAAVMAGMSSWFPKGTGGIDHLAFPLILFPAIWTLLFFYAVLESKPWRAAIIIFVLGAVNAVPVVNAVSAMRANAPEAGATAVESNEEQEP